MVIHRVNNTRQHADQKEKNTNTTCEHEYCRFAALGALFGRSVESQERRQGLLPPRPPPHPESPEVQYTHVDAAETPTFRAPRPCPACSPHINNNPPHTPAPHKSGLLLF